MPLVMPEDRWDVQEIGPNKDGKKFVLITEYCGDKVVARELRPLEQYQWELKTGDTLSPDKILDNGILRDRVKNDPVVYNDAVPVPDHTRYLISRGGDLYSTITDKFVHQQPNDKGYLKSRIYPDDGGAMSSVRIHRVVAKVFVPNPEEKPEVNHISPDKQDNRDLNLEWSTRVENMEHAVSNGLMARGTKASSSKLSADDVRRIRALIGTMSYRAIAREYDIDHHSVRYIAMGISYQDVI